MTKSTITRERIELIANFHRAMALPPSHDEIEELARIALAAMDSEPVAEVYQVPNVGICAALGPSIRMLCPLEPGTRLYRHAQQPVVPDALPENDDEDGNDIDYLEPSQVYELGMVTGWNAFRAAMLQAEPVCTCPSGNGSLRWPRPVHPGNSPVIPDGYVMVRNDGLIAELLTIAKEAADDADALAYAEFNNKSMLHTTAIADWERRAAMLNGGNDE